jgi:hypothetical protein
VRKYSTVIKRNGMGHVSYGTVGESEILAGTVLHTGTYPGTVPSVRDRNKHKSKLIASQNRFIRTNFESKKFILR